MNNPVKFKVGDIVEATGTITRVDDLCALEAGDRAKVVSVFQSSPESPQVIGLEFGNFQMKDVVCFDSIPLKLVASQSQKQDRKEKIELVLTQALNLDGDDAVQAWRRLCRELDNMTHAESRPPRFNGLLHAVWIAASNDQT